MRRRRTHLVFDRTMVAALAGALIMLQLLLFTAGFLVGATGEVQALTPPDPPLPLRPSTPAPGEGGATRLAKSLLSRFSGAWGRPSPGEGVLGWSGRGDGGEGLACAIPPAALAPEPRPQPPAPVVVAAVRVPTRPRPSPLASFMAPSLLVKASFQPPPAPAPAPAKIVRQRYNSRPTLSAIAYAPLIRAAATRHSVSPALVEAVIRIESGFNPRAVSNKGARGLMQVLPATGRRFGVRSDRLFDPELNLAVGTAYLAWLSKRYAGNLDHILAAYNAGEGAVDDHGGVPPYRETRDYVRKVRSALRSIEEALADDDEETPIPTPQVVIEEALQQKKAVPSPAEAVQEEPARGIALLQTLPALAGDQKALSGRSAGERAGAQEGADRTGAGGG